MPETTSVDLEDARRALARFEGEGKSLAHTPNTKGKLPANQTNGAINLTFNDGRLEIGTDLNAHAAYATKSGRERLVQAVHTLDDATGLKLTVTLDQDSPEKRAERLGKACLRLARDIRKAEAKEEKAEHALNASGLTRDQLAKRQDAYDKAHGNAERLRADLRRKSGERYDFYISEAVRVEYEIAVKRAAELQAEQRRIAAILAGGTPAVATA